MQSLCLQPKTLVPAADVVGMNVGIANRVLPLMLVVGEAVTSGTTRTIATMAPTILVLTLIACTSKLSLAGMPPAGATSLEMVHCIAEGRLAP